MQSALDLNQEPAPDVDGADPQHDAALLQRSAAGDRMAFTQFLRCHITAIATFARRYTASQAEAEDIVQETFTRAWMHAGRWRPAQEYSSPRSWLYRIAYNLCIDAHRKMRPESDDFDTVADPDSPERIVGRRRQDKLVHDTVRALPERQRCALWLIAHHGLSNREAAGVLGISVEALESLLARARRSVREKINALDGFSHE